MNKTPLKKQRAQVAALDEKRKNAQQKAKEAASKHQAKADAYATDLATQETKLKQAETDLIVANIDFLIELEGPCREDRQCSDHGPCVACHLEHLKDYGEWEYDGCKLHIDVYR